MSTKPRKSRASTLGYRLAEAIWTNQDLTPTDKLVMLALASHTNTNTGQCYPSIPRLVERTGLSRSTVIRTLSRMEQDGYLSASKAPGRNTRYELIKSLGVTMTPPPCHHDTPQTRLEDCVDPQDRGILRAEMAGDWKQRN